MKLRNIITINVIVGIFIYFYYFCHFRHFNSFSDEKDAPKEINTSLYPGHGFISEGTQGEQDVVLEQVWSTLIAIFNLL
jgi:hypothetical protein